VSFTIAFTVSCQREHYLRRALNSWGRVRGIQDAHLLFCLEPTRTVHSPFPMAEFRNFLFRNFRSFDIRMNEQVLGPTGNTKNAMVTAFTVNPDDFVILAEEDLLVATDILEWFTWAQRYREDAQVVTVSAHAHRSTGQPDQAVRVPWFSPLVWGTWKDRWQDFIAPGWGGLPDNPGAWDANLRSRIAGAGLCTLFPARSRAQHIGQVSTLTPGLLAEYFYGASTSTCFSPDYPPQAFTEVPGDSLELLV